MIIAFSLFFAVFGFGIYAFLKFDAALSHIYETDREQWRGLGKPRGFLWAPSEKTRFLQSITSRDELFSKFLWAGLKWPGKL